MGQSPSNDGLDEDQTDDNIDDVDEVEGSKTDKPNPRVKELSDENARRRNNEKILREQLEAAQVELKKHEDATKTEAQRVTDELGEVNKRNATLLERNEHLQVENAFLGNRKFNWRNPKTALKLLDRADVTIDKDGNMTGLDEAIAKLAADEPYLLSEDDDSDDDESDDDDLPTGQKAKKQKNTGPTPQDLVNKFPALRR